ncbi:sigma-54 dependent transcriptional regulator [Candidatus Kuenenia sp.]|uniref:sigma-54-dependent transcriptional regulator n=1 Tax=Candidatus Kuenenia sp. TaxID=2499824 RepID=UPI00321F9F08
MKAKGIILIVDDEETIRLSVREFLDAQGYEAIAAGSFEEALEKMDTFMPDLILLDLRLPNINGVELIGKIKEKDPNALMVVMTGYGSVDSAVEVMRLGAYDYLEKPFKLDRLRSVVEKALRRQGLRQEVLEIKEKQWTFDEESDGIIIGNSPQMKEIYSLIKQVAKSSSTTVLIQGESGTGKELVARAVHRLSARKSGRFVDINCAALTESLLEAELFGYEKGAFTGAATAGKPGLFEVADKGTVFLDEIGEMGVLLQAKLLRILQERQFKRVGGIHDIKIDVRIIASTNRNLEEEIASGNFRKDLYYRLKVLPIYVPPLRERREDIMLLVKYFMHKYNNEFGKNVCDIPSDTERILLEYGWPGNIRELKNVVERGVLIANGCALSPKYVANISFGKKESESLAGVAVDGNTDGVGSDGLDARSLAFMEKRHIENVLKETSWRRAEAARVLGINRTTLYNKIKEYGIAQ